MTSINPLYRISVFLLLFSLLGFGLPRGASAAVSENLTGSSWSLVGNVEQTDGVFTLREIDRTKTYAYQNIPVSPTMGNQLLLISYTAAEAVRDGDITGLPYLHGYAMNSRRRILSYLQSSSLRHDEVAGRWGVVSQTFTIPRGTTNVRLFLKQAAKRGTTKDGRAARFYAPGVFVGSSTSELNTVALRYRREIGSTPTLPTTSPPTPVPSPLFDVIWNGYGTVSLDPSLFLSPKISTSPSETHSALVASKETYRGNYEASFKMTTLAQHRTGSTPNPWETGWFLFGYKPDGTFKYLILKPNGYGIELGESLLNDRQNFLYTSRIGDENFPIGRTYDVRLRIENGIVTLFVDGTQRMRYRMTDRDLLSTDGKIGFYTEDAAVRVEQVNVRALE